MFSLVYFKAKNFIAFHTGMKTNKVELDLRDYDNNAVFILKAKNGKGKTALLSILHPLSMTTDSRSKFIRPGKDGYKELIYQDARGNRIECKVVYTSTTKGHSTKGFIKHIAIDGTETDLNPKGNITEYHEQVAEIFGIDKDFIKLTSHNDSSKGIVDMTSSERRSMAFRIIKGLAEYTPYQKAIGARHKRLKTIVASLVDKLGKLKDESEIESLIEEANDELDKLGYMRDKALEEKGSATDVLKNYPSDYDILNINKKIGDYNLRIHKLKEELVNIERICGGTSYSGERLSSLIKAKNIELVGLNQMSNRILEDIDKQSENLTQLEIQIAKLKTSIKDNSVDSLDEISERIEDYYRHLEEFAKEYSWLSTNISKEDLLFILSIQTTIHDSIEGIYGYHAENVHYILDYIYKHGIDKTSDMLSEKDTSAYMRIEELNREIIEKETELQSLIDKADEQSEILSMRPRNCVDDNCPFITESIKYQKIRSTFKEREDIIKSINEEIDTYSKIRQDLNEQFSVLKSIENLWRLIDSADAIMPRVPKPIRITKVGMIEAFIKNNLGYFNRDYESYIDVIEKKKDFDESNSTIESLIQRKKFIEENKELFQSGKDRLEELEAKYLKELETQGKLKKESKGKLDEIEAINEEIESLSKLHKFVERGDEIREELPQLNQKIQMLKDDSEKYNRAKGMFLVADKDIRNIESEIQPLSSKKVMYLHEQLKIKEYQSELKILEDDLSVVTLIKDAVSLKGMPTLLIDFYMEDVRRIANTLLTNTFDGGLYLEEFQIDESEFTIPYRKNGEIADDISMASTSERAFIRLAVSLALYEVYGSNQYGTILLDEVDGGLDDENIDIFSGILLKQVERLGMTRIFIITHNKEHYRGTDHVTIHFKKGKNDIENIYLLK